MESGSEQVTGIILAGGRSSRFGNDKAFAFIGRERLIERAVHQLKDFSDLLVVTNERIASLYSLSLLPVRVVFDEQPGMGPMGGIHSGLKAARNEYSLVVACDMPFLNHSLLEYMVNARHGYDMVVPRTHGLPEPLHAIYSKNCLPAIKQRLIQGKAMVYGLLDGVRVRFVEQEEVERFDPDHISFFNINNSADLERARELAVRLAPELLAEDPAAEPYSITNGGGDRK